MSDASFSPTATVSDGTDLQQFGSAFRTDMSEVMDSLQFSLGDIALPWDAEGNITAFTTTIGTPEEDGQLWQLQTTPFTCAVVAQRGIIEAFTGEDISEAQLVYEATINGWLTDGGMSPLDAGRLLELHGIPCHVQMGATVEELIAELTQGHKVIVGVDSGELWNQDSFLEDFFHQAADHAVWVTGINMGDPAHPKIIVNDSGDPHGAGKEYDLSDFVAAWQDSGFFYVATDNTPPHFHLAARGFDPATGAFSDMVAYLTGLYSDFPRHLQSQGSLAKLAEPGMVAEAAVLMPHLMENPLASLDDAARDQLLLTI